jgi:CheY-like chemotaxis protein
MKSNRKARVLVVDDHRLTRLATVFTLSGIGLEADEAASGEEAISLASANHYTLIFMDYNMTGMDGIECAKQIRKLEEGGSLRAAIVGFTASIDRNIEQKCLEAGMDAYLSKSCAENALIEITQKYLGNIKC